MSGAQAATWPIPTPPQLFNQAASVYETNPALAGIDARSANSVASTNCRLYALGSYDRYLMQANLAQELMPDTAVVWLPRHANIWGVPQLQPTPATGNAVFSGATGTPIPSGAILTYQTALYMTTSSAEVGSEGTVSVPITSVQGGSAYNLPAGTTLNLVSAISGLNPQAGVLDSNGAANGTDLEEIEHWRGRILAAIRVAANGGSLSDYYQWAADGGAQYTNVVPNGIGAGSVLIYIWGPGPSVASDQLVTAVQNFIGVYNGTPSGVRPVTANAVVVAGTLLAQNVTANIDPFTETTEASAGAAIALFFQQNAAGGAPLYYSRLDNAISNAADVFDDDLTTPSGNVTCLASQIIVLGTVTLLPP